MDNYKGLYYKESKEQKFYEGGAHFSYEKLYEVLYYLKEEDDQNIIENSPLYRKEENEDNNIDETENNENKNTIKVEIEPPSRFRNYNILGRNITTPLKKN